MNNVTEPNEPDILSGLGLKALGIKLKKDIPQLLKQLANLEPGQIRKNLEADHPIPESIQALKHLGARVNYSNDDGAKFEGFVSSYLTANHSEWVSEFARELISSLEKHEVFSQLSLLRAIGGNDGLNLTLFLDLLTRTLELSSEDLAQGEIWTIFDRRVSASDVAFEIIDELKNETEHRGMKEEDMIKSACLKIARQERDKKLRQKFAERLGAFEESDDPHRREVLYKSFVGCDRAEIEALMNYLVRDIQHKSLIEELILRSLLGDVISVGDKKKILESMMSEVGEDGFSDSSKYCLVSLLDKFIQEEPEFSLVILKAALPISSDHIGTWNLLSMLLGSIKEDDTQLAKTIEITARLSPESLLDFLGNMGSNIVSLSSVKKCPELDSAALRLSVDENRSIQQVGLTLLDSVTDQSLPAEQLKTMSLQSLRRLFCGSQLTRLSSKASGRIFGALTDPNLPLLQDQEEELYSEIQYQYFNTSEFRDSFDGHAVNHDFKERVKRAHDSSTNRDDSFYDRRGKFLFETSHYLDTRQLAGRISAKEMGKAMDNSSLLMHLCTQIFFPYGKDASLVRSDGTQTKMEMKHIEHSQELPWLELASPEKEKYRRTSAAVELNQRTNNE